MHYGSYKSNHLKLKDNSFLWSYNVASFVKWIEKIHRYKETNRVKQSSPFFFNFQIGSHVLTAEDSGSSELFFFTSEYISLLRQNIIRSQKTNKKKIKIKKLPNEAKAYITIFFTFGPW